VLPGTLQRIEQRLSWRVVAGAAGLAIGFGGTQLVLPAPGVPAATAEQPPGQAMGLTGRTPVPTSEPVYFRNCDAVWAAGAAPIRRGQPGYGGHLDRDGDGVGCE
jgi:hypothetical protein